MQYVKYVVLSSVITVYRVPSLISAAQIIFVLPFVCVYRLHRYCKIR
jgi:hypothetical protein